MKPWEQSQQNRLLKHLAMHCVTHAHLMHAVLIENHEDVVRLSRELAQSVDIAVAYIHGWKFPLFEDKIPPLGWRDNPGNDSDLRVAVSEYFDLLEAQQREVFGDNTAEIIEAMEQSSTGARQLAIVRDRLYRLLSRDLRTGVKSDA